MNLILKNDILELINLNTCGDFLDNKTILITGANGLIAKYFTLYCLMYNKIKHTNIHVIALIRKNNCPSYCEEWQNDKNFTILVQDVCDYIDYDGNVDYIFHAAGNASAAKIRTNPTDIIKANLIGTINVLEFAKDHNTKKVIFPSTREIYGKVTDVEKIKESDMGTLDPLENRNCYPESKRMAETILKAYCNQYNINFNILRIAHTYGPTMPLSNDGRVMSDLLNFVVNDQDIVLNSDGSVMRAFCYILDAINAILLVLEKGQDNEAYNLSNNKEPISIKDLGNKIITFSNKKLKLQYQQASEEILKGYTSYKIVNMDNSKLESLGWMPKITLNEGIKRTLDFFSEEK